ncbi:MAG: CPXCG motif-containing cysteine-rich protein [Oleiphilus sp.]|nr:MAG: CPXCG motif-containing cysteine-rich protein [Oleiphilus sp.]
MSLLETRDVHCPYCGERIELLVDCSVAEQEYTEDCFVCCRPIIVHLAVEDQEHISVSVRTENE